MHRSLHYCSVFQRESQRSRRDRDVTPRAAPLRSEEDGGFLEAASADIRRPKPSASAEDVVTAQMNALQAGDAMRRSSSRAPRTRRSRVPGGASRR